MRQRKPANIGKDLRTYAAPLVDNPCDYQGTWRQAFMPDATEVRLDLGCGKGSFIAEAAAAEPDVLFVGVDLSETCVARSAQKVCEAGLKNVRLIIADASSIDRFFGEGELDRIYLNFNSPFPKKKYAAKRLTYLDHLLRYRLLLKEDGMLDLRTDNVLYWEFSLGQLEIANYNIVQRTDDLHADAAAFNTVLSSEYDTRTVARGAHVRCLHAVPGPALEHYQQTTKLGLTEYLPEDLSTFDEVPYGMEDTLTNMRNRKANEAKSVTKGDAHFLSHFAQDSTQQESSHENVTKSERPLLSHSITLALAQTKHPEDGNVLALVERFAAQAAERGADLLVFPECLMTPFEKTPEDFAASAQAIDGPFTTSMGEIAARYGLWMVFTMNETNSQGRPFNTAVVVDAAGNQQGVYRKTHLYIAHALDESEKMAFGPKLFPPIKTPFCKLGLGICYDLRFPEVARAAALEGCQLLVFPAAWVDGPQKKEHWETLLKARAIENELFIAGCCRADDRYIGHSLVTDPLGRVLAEAGAEEELLVVDLDLGAIESARDGMPIFAHRRPTLYEPLTR